MREHQQEPQAEQRLLLISSTAGVSLVFWNIVQAAAADIPAAFSLDSKLIHKDSISTAHTLANGDCLLGAVSGAGAALHAGVSIGDRTHFSNDGEDLLRANINTYTTAVTFALIQLQGYYVFKIPEFHQP